MTVDSAPYPWSCDRLPHDQVFQVPAGRDQDQVAGPGAVVGWVGMPSMTPSMAS